MMTYQLKKMNKSVMWTAGFFWALWAMMAFGWAACGGDDTAGGKACQTDEDCPWGSCNQQTHECESDEQLDAGAESDGGNQARDAGDDADGGDVDGAHQDQDAEVLECSSDDECRDPQRPICDEGHCRGCSGDTECSDRWPDRPHCDAGRCIGVCGNGSIDVDEECDTQEFGGATCATETGLDQGDLTCTADCHIDTSACHQCGNGVIDGDEACDGQDFGTATCATETGLDQGGLACTADCHIDTSACHQCGNGTIEGPEECDGANLQGHSCQDFGFDLGDLDCASDCMSFDQGNCTNCGNGTCDDGETTGSCPQDCGWVDVAAGKDVACGIKADGTLWCWGNNARGQVGIGTWGTEELSPVQVQDLTGVTKVSVGGSHVCALTSGGGYYCWGDNHRYEIRTDYSPVKMEIDPYDMQVQTAADGLVAGGLHTCRGVRAQFSQNMTLYCRGDNTMGQLANGDTSNSPVGQDVQVPGGFTRVFTSTLKTQCATTHYFSTSQNRVVDEVRCWGANDERQAVPTTSDVHVTSPEVIGGFDGVSGGSGDTFTCALSTTGLVICWGSNNHWQRGIRQAAADGWNHIVWNSPLDGLTVGAQHACAWRNNDGALICWGSNYHHGVNSSLDMSVLPTRVTLPNNEETVKAAAGQFFTCALTNSRRIYCWGESNKGQVGYGGTTSWGGVMFPTEVDDPYGD